MSKIRLTKRYTFETGHALYGYDGKCKNVHGHGYKMFVTIIGEPIQDSDHVKHGMVMDFGDLKKIVKEEIVDKYDHAIVFNKNSPHKELGETLKEKGHHVILADFQPTSEMLVLHFADIIRKRLPENIELYSIKLQETETSYAEWYASDND
ncbi:MAG TPA: 6-carboxytetrahydropterin synthase [Flavobacteriaceae bacterium]|nr:6-carboxytetrahydropterin synthase [Flavobacteriaceae bacterium]